MSARGVDLDLVEVVPPEWPISDIPCIAPTDITINGLPVMAPKDSEITIQTLAGVDVITATLTLMVRRLRVHAEHPAAQEDSPIYDRTCFLFNWNPLEEEVPA